MGVGIAYAISYLVLIDAVLQPMDRWAQADKQKGYWVFLLLLFGPVTAVIYLLAIRPNMGTAESAASDPFRKR